MEDQHHNPVQGGHEYPEVTGSNANADIQVDNIDDSKVIDKEDLDMNDDGDSFGELDEDTEVGSTMDAGAFTATDVEVDDEDEEDDDEEEEEEDDDEEQDELEGEGEDEDEEEGDEDNDNDNEEDEASDSNMKFSLDDTGSTAVNDEGPSGAPTPGRKPKSRSKTAIKTKPTRHSGKLQAPHPNVVANNEVLAKDIRRVVVSILENEAAKRLPIAESTLDENTGSERRSKVRRLFEDSFENGDSSIVKNRGVKDADIALDRRMALVAPETMQHVLTLAKTRGECGLDIDSLVEKEKAILGLSDVVTRPVESLQTRRLNVVSGPDGNALRKLLGDTRRTIHQILADTKDAKDAKKGKESKATVVVLPPLSEQFLGPSTVFFKENGDTRGVGLKPLQNGFTGIPSRTRGVTYGWTNVVPTRGPTTYSVKRRPK